MNIKTIRMIMWATIAVLIAGVGLTTFGGFQNTPGSNRLGTGLATIGGPFTLINTKGETVTQDDFNNKPLVVFFGYTFCPEVCPTTLFDMSQWIEALGDNADKLHFALITVDPERDTPEVLAEYTSDFADGKIHGLGGSKEQIQAVIKAYRVYVRKVSEDGAADDDYIMDHTTTIYLMKKGGAFHGTIAYQENTNTAVEKLLRLAGIK
ncbi:MAG: SCO family protein [Cohaesibacteraceae bacterium]|nr:SCO family protein [Cohaesibacteraceae bacterium]